jgi:hypothetical protein
MGALEIIAWHRPISIKLKGGRRSLTAVLTGAMESWNDRFLLPFL